MPKLNDNLASQVDGQEVREGFDRTPLEAGTYVVRLREVEAKRSTNDNPMWVCVFEVVSDSEGDAKNKGKRLWTNLVFTDNALWKVAQFFRAFETEANTDTDELLGEQIRVSVSKRVIQSGSREGELGNNIDSFLTLAPGSEDGESKPKAKAKAKVGATAVDESDPGF